MGHQAKLIGGRIKQRVWLLKAMGMPSDMAMDRAVN